MLALYLLVALIVLFIGACLFLNWLGRAEKFPVAPQTVAHDEHEEGLLP
jgi:hypothetical protein